MRAARSLWRWERRGCASRQLTEETMNPRMRDSPSGRRDAVSFKADNLRRLLRQKPEGNPELMNLRHDDLISIDQIGNFYFKQILAVCACPELMKYIDFKRDVLRMVELILKDCRNYNIGAMSNADGLPAVKELVTRYLFKRDNILTSPSNIIIGNGTSPLIKMVVQLFSNSEADKRSGIMIPVPRDPFYAACLTHMNIHQIDYFLVDNSEWKLDEEDVQKSIDSAKEECIPRAIVIANPGNPTGQVFTEDTLKSLLEFAHREKLVVIADESCQNSIHGKEIRFKSMKQLLNEMNSPYNEIELFSFYSITSGPLGTGGLRGGFMEMVNIETKVKVHLQKIISDEGCPNLPGQVALAVLMHPPYCGDPSSTLYMKQVKNYYRALRENSALLSHDLSRLDGWQCTPIQASNFLFPQICIPDGLLCEAESFMVEPDVYYCLLLADKQGVCLMPGSCFGKLPDNTFRVRITVPQNAERTSNLISRLKEFHNHVTKKYNEKTSGKETDS